jgi:hypothetical protein
MTMRERFTEEEWGLVRHVPFDAFLFGALADQKIEDEEVAAFTQTLERAAALTDPLHREIALSYTGAGVADVGAEMRFQMGENAEEMSKRLDRTKAMLKEHLTGEEYQSFVTSVTINALLVAGASTKKKGIFRKKEVISEEEAQALAVFAATWEVDPAALQAHLSPG